MSRTLYFVAGEASGDHHGAALIGELKRLAPDIVFVGRGGPEMAGHAAAPYQDWIAEAGVVGLWEVLRKYGYFRRAFQTVLSEIDQVTPDAVVLIDYPGFNLRLSRALRRKRPRLKIIYYISPQVWAWHRGRIPQMAHDLNLMLCIFPFEEALYQTSGLRTRFVGHPIKLRPRRTDDAMREEKLSALFPGSREREVAKNLPVMIAAARLLLADYPGLNFEISAASEARRAQIETVLKREGAGEFRVATVPAAQLMERAWSGLVASGTATLEAAYHRMPFVLVYRVAWLTYHVARSVVKLNYLGMPNVLAGREIVPEFIQHRATPPPIVAAWRSIHVPGAARTRMQHDFDEVIAKLGATSASSNAASAILEELATA